MNIEDLGIDIKQLKYDIVQETSDKLSRNLCESMKDELYEDMQDLISLKLNSLIEESIIEKYQPVDEFGETVGQPLSIKQAFKNQCKNWWTQKVDEKSGYPSTSYNAITREKYIFNQVIGTCVEKQLNKMTQETLKAIKAESKDQFIELVKRIAEKQFA